jgi:hypothetical protein
MKTSKSARELFSEEVTFYFTKEQRKWIKQKAREQKISMSEVVRSYLFPEKE